MSLGHYLPGLAALAFTLGGTGLAAWTVVHRRMAGSGRSAQVLAVAVLVMAGLVVAHVVPGVLTVLDRWTAAAAAVGLGAAARALVRPGAPAPAMPAPAPPPAGRPSWAAAAVAAGGFAAFAVAFLADRRGVAITAIDWMSFEGPQAARWIADGSLWPIAHFVPDWAFGQYPGNGSLLQVAVMLPWRDDAFVRPLGLVLLTLAALGAYVLARELGATRPAALTFAAAACAVPVAALPALEQGKPDVAMWAGFAAGAAFLARHARTRAGVDLSVAGAGLALAFGAKWYGVAQVPALVAVWGVASLLARRPRGEVLRHGAVLAGVIGAGGAFWLLRNWVQSANPVYPVKVELAGVTVFDAPPDPNRGPFGFSILEYAGSPDVWRDVLAGALWDGFGPFVVLVLLAVPVAAALAWRRRDGRVLAVAAAAALVGALYVALPYTAIGPRDNPYLAAAAARYAVPALLLAAPLTAWLAGRLGRPGVALEALGAVTVVVAVSRYDVLEPAVAAGELVRPGPVLAVAGAGILTALVWRRPRLTVAAAVAAAAAGWIHADRYDEGRYLGLDPALDRLVTDARSGHRVGLVGSAPGEGGSVVLPALGPRFGNHAVTIGPLDRHLLGRYESRGAFTAALRRGRYDLVVASRADPARPGREEAWASSAGYEVVTRSGRHTLLRLRDGR